ncbi:hypothetical protein OS493_037988 [Desmophyllum pertusum]|uniref:Uncharacterized protein n=1 Tax=Desmophyllum pertusum TaxID=174260 RepID=A0A9W9Z8G6_9CNID|nr:hypothetical protein OS493_037988 [Desmophyllum pertusum]
MRTNSTRQWEKIKQKDTWNWRMSKALPISEEHRQIRWRSREQDSKAEQAFNTLRPVLIINTIKSKLRIFTTNVKSIGSPVRFRDLKNHKGSISSKLQPSPTNVL